MGAARCLTEFQKQMDKRLMALEDVLLADVGLEPDGLGAPEPHETSL